jgi:S-DNA-T family DNA segregation ATPase FtsK/SpoIIIE
VDLGVVLIDFKGGSAFDTLAGLPHVAGLVTNLDADPVELRRVRTSLDAELQRRQRMLRGPDPAALPALLLVVDEAGELLAQSPEFADLFARIGRIGRSLRVHLLLATQRWDDGRFRALDPHLRVRLCLRTFTRDDSRAVLGTDLAAGLPPTPGAGILSIDGTSRRIDVLAATGRLRPRSGRGTPRIWRPPLPHRIDLTHLPRTAPAQLAIGIIDVPEAQGQPPLVIDADGPGGNLVVAGGPRSGVSTALRTVVDAYARAPDGGHLAVHVLDLTGGLIALRDHPCVGTYAGPDADRGWLAEILAGLGDMIDERQRAQSVPRGRVLLVVDGAAGLRTPLHDAVDLEPTLLDVATRGLAFGVHLAAGIRRWADLRAPVLDACGTRVELRLADPKESHAGREAAQTVTCPGRGVLPDGHTVQIAVPDEIGPRSSTTRVTPILPLPQRVFAPAGYGDGAFPLGITGRAQRPVLLDVLGAGTHLTIAGNPRTGRSTALRRIVEYLRAASPDQVSLTVIDPRRQLGVDDLVLSRPSDITEHVRQLVDVLRSRLDAYLGSADAPAHPHHCIVIDDLPLAHDASGLLSRRGAVADLAELLPWSEELRLHLFVAHPAGAGRLGNDPVLAGLRGAGAAELLLAGDHDGLARRSRTSEPAGRGLFAQIGSSPILVQCYLDEPGDSPGG